MLPTKKNQKRWSLVFSVLGLAIGAAILIYLFYQVRTTMDVRTLISSVHPIWLVGAALCVPAYESVDALIFYLMGRGSGSPVRLDGCFDAAFIGEFYYRLGPAGAPVQLGLMYSAGMPATVTASVYTWKMVANTLVYTLYAVAALVFKLAIQRVYIGPAVIGTSILLGLYMLLCAVILLFAWRPEPIMRLVYRLLTSLARYIRPLSQTDRVPNIMKKIAAFSAQLVQLRDKHKVLAGMFGCMFLELTILFAIPIFLYHGLGLTGASVADLLLTQCLVMVISRIVMLPGNAGGAEGSFYLFMGPIFGQSLTIGLVLWRCVAFLEVMLLGGAWSVVRFFKKSLRRTPR